MLSCGARTCVPTRRRPMPLPLPRDPAAHSRGGGVGARAAPLTRSSAPDRRVRARRGWGLAGVDRHQGFAGSEIVPGCSDKGCGHARACITQPRALPARAVGAVHTGGRRARGRDRRWASAVDVDLAARHQRAHNIARAAPCRAGEDSVTLLVTLVVAHKGVLLRVVGARAARVDRRVAVDPVALQKQRRRVRLAGVARRRKCLLHRVLGRLGAGPVRQSPEEEVRGLTQVLRVRCRRRRRRRRRQRGSRATCGATTGSLCCCGGHHHGGAPRPKRCKRRARRPAGAGQGAARQRPRRRKRGGAQSRAVARFEVGLGVLRNTAGAGRCERRCCHQSTPCRARAQRAGRRRGFVAGPATSAARLACTAVRKRHCALQQAAGERAPWRALQHLPPHKCCFKHVDGFAARRDGRRGSHGHAQSCAGTAGSTPTNHDREAPPCDKACNWSAP